ncbi:MAG: DUF1587 domain-containing protein, partial [Pirellulaceae bacterium]|nr:DUF1587 domain-containing protein [Pirellulaceae bacterium]
MSRIHFWLLLVFCSVPQEYWHDSASSWAADSPIASPPIAGEPSALFPTEHRELVERLCMDCHDRETREGKVDLQSLSFDLATIESAEVWQKVLGAVNAGDMPPNDEAQFTASEKSKFLEDLSKTLVTARRILSDSGGAIAMRRLNRREYANTMRELLNVSVDVADLPDDASTDGFDTAGGSLFFSSDQFEQYLKIARRAVADAVATGQRPETKTVKRQAEVAANKLVNSRVKALQKKLSLIEAWRASDKPPTEFGFIDEARVDFEQGQYDQGYPYFHWYQQHQQSKSGAILGVSAQGAYVDMTNMPKTPGDYILRARVGAFADATANRRFLELGIKTRDAQAGELKVIDCRQVTGSLADPQVIEFAVSVSKHSSGQFGLRERQPNSRDAARHVYRTARSKNGIGPEPALWIDWIELQGPLITQWPPQSHRNIFGDSEPDQKTDAYARSVIERFATRAFRIKRPSATFVDKLFAL